MHEGGSGDGSVSAGPGPAAHGSAAADGAPRCGAPVAPGAFERRSRLQRQQEVADGSAEALQREAPERGSLTPAMRKEYLRELLRSNASHGGFSGVLSAQPPAASCEQNADCVLDPTEHAWMVSAVEGSYDTILEFITEDPHLLNRRDFISGYSVLHWLAKSGRDETLIKLLRHAEGAGTPANVDLRGSGGLTPLHVACMHGQYMVVKLLVGAFGADVDAMDYGGRRAWQYLRGDAPLEMKELLGAWDDEHRRGGAQGDVGGNANNNSAGAAGSAARDEVDGAAAGQVNLLDRTKRGGSWRFGSLRKLLPSLSFLGNRS